MGAREKLHAMVDELDDIYIRRAELYLEKLLRVQSAERRLDGDLSVTADKVRVVDAVLGDRLVDAGVRCSFCGKKGNEVIKLSVMQDVFMCNECLNLCQAIMDEEHGRPQ